MATGEDDEKVSVEPGAIRTRDVKVDRHVAISPGLVRGSSHDWNRATSRLPGPI